MEKIVQGHNKTDPASMTNEPLVRRSRGSCEITAGKRSPAGEPADV